MSDRAETCSELRECVRGDSHVFMNNIIDQWNRCECHVNVCESTCLHGVVSYIPHNHRHIHTYINSKADIYYFSYQSLTCPPS